MEEAVLYPSNGLGALAEGRLIICAIYFRALYVIPLHETPTAVAFVELGSGVAVTRGWEEKMNLSREWNVSASRGEEVLENLQRHAHVLTPRNCTLENGHDSKVSVMCFLS